MQAQNLPFLNIDSPEETLQKLRIRLLQVILVFFIISSISITVTTLADGRSLFSAVNLIQKMHLFIKLA